MTITMSQRPSITLPCVVDIVAAHGESGVELF